MPSELMIEAVHRTAFFFDSISVPEFSFVGTKL